ncbi:MAG: dihydrodipicolinate reductase [Myxococcota bacterium]
MSYRVVVWGPGNVGAPAVRSVVADPRLELVGVAVHSPEKEGVDVGALVGLPPLGLTATRDVESLLATRPDAVFYGVNQDFRPAESQDEMVAALAAGSNVLTAGFYPLLHPASAPEPVRERFAEACREGRSTFLASGIDPGFLMDLLPLTLSGVCERIDEIRMVENFNYATYEVPAAVRAIIGFGSPMDRVPPMLSPGVPTSVWGGAVRGLGAALGLEVSEVREVVERHPLERDVELSDALLPAGTLGAFRFEVQGVVGGRPVLVVEHVTRIVDDTAPQWPRARGMGHHQVRISGRPKITLTFEAEVDGDHVAGGNAAAAARLVHAIPFVCDAPPGLLSGADVPAAVGTGLLTPCR